jgi:hypothetical protein
MSANRFRDSEDAARRAAGNALGETSGAATALDVHDSLTFVAGQPTSVDVFGQQCEVSPDGHRVVLHGRVWSLIQRRGRYCLVTVV